MTEVPADILPLAADFPSATRQQWLELVGRLLKGAPFERLVARTYDGLTLQPLYAGSLQTHAPLARTPGGRWQILQRIDHPDPAAANAEARHDCANGADGLSLVLAGAIGAYGYGLGASEAAIARALDGIALDGGVALELDAGPFAEDAARSLAALVAPARHAGGRRQYSFRLRSARQHGGHWRGGHWRGGCWRSGGALERDRGTLSPLDHRARRRRLQGPVLGRGWTSDPQRGRLRGAGARLRARSRHRLSARARKLRHRPR